MVNKWVWTFNILLLVITATLIWVLVTFEKSLWVDILAIIGIMISAGLLWVWGSSLFGK